MAKPLPGIEHVIVLMLENRSFDNVLGGLYPERTKRGFYRGLLGTETNPLDPRKQGGSSVSVFQGPPVLDTWIMPYPDPGELYTDMVQQIYGAYTVPSGGVPTPMSGFAWNYMQQSSSPDGVAPVARDIMQYYSGATMQVSSYLAQQYAVCDCWFAAAPVQTLSNRVITHCGTPSRLNPTTSRVNNPDYTNSITVPFVPPVTDKTIFELLDQKYPAGKGPACSDFTPPPPQTNWNWKIYYHDAPLSALCSYVYSKWCFDYVYGGNVYDYDKNFEYDVRNDNLPKYSFIEPRYSDFFYGPVNSNHPGGAGIDFADFNGQSLPPPINVLAGESLLLQVYSILLERPDVFAKTLLIVTYDEHGGLFDHIGPPRATSPFQPAVTNFNYDRYGVRVPTIFINPNIKPGLVYPERQLPNPPLPNPPYDHTSILSTLIDQFELGSDYLSPRVKAAPRLIDLVSSTAKPEARPPLKLPARVSPPPTIQEPRPRPPIPNVPRNSHTLAGTLGSLYHVIQNSKRGRRS